MKALEKSEAMSTGIELSKTECPMCGNVCQEHTLNQLEGCMAIMHLEFSVARGRGGNTRATTTTDEPCPVCHKLPYEHTNDDIRSCLGKWRKRERGATGLELRGEFLDGHFENEEPDPVKRAQLRAQARKRLCLCGKARGNHTLEEFRACAERNRPKRW